MDDGNDSALFLYSASFCILQPKTVVTGVCARVEYVTAQARCGRGQVVVFFLQLHCSFIGSCSEYHQVPIVYRYV
jgi:hypothetical protein